MKIRIFLVLGGLFLASCNYMPSKNNASHKVIRDVSTGLMWKRCPEGLTGNMCDSGEAEEINWQEAMLKYKSDVSYAGYNNWRLPTKNELKTIVLCKNGLPPAEKKTCGEEANTIDTEKFPNNGRYSWYWTSSEQETYFNSKKRGIVVHFNGGYIATGLKSHKNRIRLVRKIE